MTENPGDHLHMTNYQLSVVYLISQNLRQKELEAEQNYYHRFSYDDQY